MNAQQRRQLEPLLLNAVRETGKELGRGAYGVVIEVNVSGTVCAAKKLHEAIVQDYTLTKFSDEVVVHSQQRHPNIVQLMGVYYPPRSRLPMLIMEHLPFSLTQCLEKEELPLQMKYCILHDVAKGLCYLHGKRPPIVHRDLTANNVLLTSSYTAKISDLGVSRLADTFKKQELSIAPGNAMVMPPEALKDDPVYDHKLDVFSYGCLIIHVLTGQFPEPTKHFVKKSRDVIVEVPEWDRRLRHIQQIPKENELLPLAKRCLNDPTSRPEMIESYQFVEKVLLEYPKLKTVIELTQENEVLKMKLHQVTEEKSVTESQLHELEDRYSILETMKEKEVLSISFEDHEKAIKALEKENEEVIAKLVKDNKQQKEYEFQAITEAHKNISTVIKEYYKALLTKQEESNKALLAKVEESYKALLTEQEERHNALRTEQEERHNALLTKLKERHITLLTEQEERHNASLTEQEEIIALHTKQEERHIALLTEQEESYKALYTEIKKGYEALLAEQEERYEALLRQVPKTIP